MLGTKISWLRGEELRTCSRMQVVPSLLYRNAQDTAGYNQIDITVCSSDLWRIQMESILVEKVQTIAFDLTLSFYSYRVNEGWQEPHGAEVS